MAVHTFEKNGEGRQRYTVVDGKKYILTKELQQAWDEMINSNRHYAQHFGMCGQADYHKCFGDCGLCPYAREGAIISTDKEVENEEGTIGVNGFGYSESAEDEYMRTAALESVFEYAARLEERGDEILRVRFRDPEKPTSTHKIAAELGIPATTVNDRLNRLLKAIRKNREDYL